MLRAWPILLAVTSGCFGLPTPGGTGGSGGGNHATLTVSPPGPVTVFVGETLQLKGVTDPPGTELVWESSLPSTVSVDQTGLVTALTSGDALITATIAGGSASKSVQVSSKVIGPRNPSFEDNRPCNWGNETCAAEWVDDSKCQQGVCTYSCTTTASTGQGSTIGLPSDGSRVFTCGGDVYAYQDNVDFGPSTQLLFDYGLARSDTGTCPSFAMSLQFAGASQPLWQATGAPCTSGQYDVLPRTPVAVTLPVGLAPGRLTLRVTSHGGIAFFDHFRVQ